jgi:hypothetical protein
MQSPAWEANQFSATREIPRTLGKPKIHYHSLLIYPTNALHLKHSIVYV